VFTNFAKKKSEIQIFELDIYLNSMIALAKPVYIFMICFLPYLQCRGQKEANVWYFGHQIGLNFNAEPPEVLLDGQLDINDGSTESAASISDRNGDLLFYTNGVTVWNRAHNIMPDGTGLYGTNTTTQTLIVPLPGNDRLYYIFTASPQGDADYDNPPEKRGFRYSLVDMAQDNGLGAVTEKNVLLSVSTTEKMAATRHANGRDVWVVMHEWNSKKFRAYLITAQGLQLSYVISDPGSVLPADHTELAPGDAIGQMKFSANGERLAFVTYISHLLEVYDFDLLTGKLSLLFSFSNFVQPWRLYGLEFSPSGQYIYITISGCGILQVDLGNENILVLSNKKEPICPNSAQLQVGPDGKIYIAILGSQLIGVINNPDELGESSNWDSHGILIPVDGVHYCSSGLPNFISSYFYKNPELYPQSPYFEMPNVFTPNGDGINDVSEPMSLFNVQSLMLSIYNRWGDLVFQNTSMKSWWDGDGYAPGVYFWHTHYEGINGKSYSQKGYIQLMR